MPPIHSHTRRAEKSQPLNPIYIAGFCVVGAIILGVAIWLLVRLQRKRAMAKREDIRGAAFLSVQGLVREGSQPKTEKDDTLPSTGPAVVGALPQINGFSRTQMNDSVVLPEKVLHRPPRIHIDTSSDALSSGTLPKPFSFALSAGPSPAKSPGFLSPISSSGRLSISSRRSHFSVTSTATGFSLETNPTSGTIRKFRQMFDPVLPDELLVARAGEQVTLLQSFDDGWCLVGRENSTFVETAKSLFKQNTTPESNMEIGVVPAWCFLKPVLGLRAERPIRSSSLGITVQMTTAGAASRESVISWSNF